LKFHGMGVERGAAGNKVVETARSLPRFIEADGQPAIGQPGECAATEQALQINYPIKMLGAQGADAAPDLTPVLRFSPALAVKENEASEVRVPEQQRRQFGLDPPIDLAARKVAFDQAQHRQCLDHVAQRTGL
jgi:hypothetical protein